MPLYSIIIPAFNEADSVAQLHTEIAQVAETENLDVELIFVDDGSTDGSWKTIEQLVSVDDRVRGIRFRRNFGKAAALDAGIHEADGEILITMDADLQDNPNEIPKLLARLNDGQTDESDAFDVVSGWKKVRHDPIHKTVPSKIFNWLVGSLTGVHLHDHNCGFKAYRREVFDDVELYGERHRFIPVLAAAHGWRVTEQAVEHRPRVHGKSKYGFSRFLKGLLDLMSVYFLTGYRNRPLHLLGSIGLGFFGIGAVCLIYLAIYWFVRVIGQYESWDPLHQRPLVFYALGALLLGAQLISIGFLAELITATNRRHGGGYSIRSTINTNSPAHRTREKARHQLVADKDA